MERLTWRGKRGINADIIGIDISDMCGNLTIYKIGILESAIDRLAAYEESALTPEEVMELAKIVRCRDCEMYSDDGCSMSGFFGQRFYENDFCSKARKRK